MSFNTYGYQETIREQLAQIEKLNSFNKTCTDLLAKSKALIEKQDETLKSYRELINLQDAQIRDLSTLLEMHKSR